MKIVLAYSGGLDTSICIPWLKQKFHAEIIAYTANVGQKEDPARLKEKALRTGAAKFYYEDARQQFVDEYILRALAADAIYQEKYPLATALSRPLIAANMARVARREKADAFAHGCTGKGNDQVRFELTFKYLAPGLQVIAPVREWQFKSREEEIEYAQQNDIPVSVTKKSPYSIDWNLWGISIECGALENPWTAPPEDAYQITRSPAQAPARPQQVTIAFERGVPVGLNGRKMPVLEIIAALNAAGGRHGVGRVDLLEDRLVGIKSREIYEAPAAIILHNAHTELERLVMSKELFNFKRSLGPWYAQLVYNGLWFSQFREALDAFVRATQEYVTGDVKLTLYRGNCTVTGRRSPFSMYQEALATYTRKDAFDHTAAKGFLDIYGLPSYLEGLRAKQNTR